MAKLGPEEISGRTRARKLKKFGFTRKKTYGSQEREEVKRVKFKEEIALYVPQDIVYIDEYGMDNKEDYSYGWNEKGNRFYAQKSCTRKERINMIAALCNGQ